MPGGVKTGVCSVGDGTLGIGERTRFYVQYVFPDAHVALKLLNVNLAKGPNGFGQIGAY